MRLPRHLKGRLGFTTGACATAALKAALLALKGTFYKEVVIKLPIGQKACFKIHRLEKKDLKATASVIKDAGDDPDITHRAEIVVSVNLSHGQGEIVFIAGEGVGLVTKPGLGLPIGEPAITKIPRKMMESTIEEILGEERKKLKVEIEISIPKGEELAQRTLNPRLGIRGGLSILGTKGVVIPYSTAAYKATIAKALLVAKRGRVRRLVLATGGRTEAYAQRLFPELAEEAFIQMGDYVGFSLHTARALGFQDFILAMMIGKLSKLAAGFRETHVRHGEVPLKMLLELAKAQGAPPRIIQKLASLPTARGFLETLMEEGPPEVLQRFLTALMEKALEEALKGLKNPVRMEIVLFDSEGRVLARRKR